VTRTQPLESAVEAAIGSVLAAERAASDAVADAQRKAVTVDEAARERVQAITSRTERRMQRVRAAFEDMTRSAVGAIASEASLYDHGEPDAADRRAVADAVAALAAKLTGGRA
jgi:hypothetical protein